MFVLVMDLVEFVLEIKKKNSLTCPTVTTVWILQASFNFLVKNIYIGFLRAVVNGNRFYDQ